MKKLISAQTVKQIHSDGKKEIVAPAKSTIITPEAETIAKELGIKFVAEASAQHKPEKSDKITVNETMIKQVIEKVMEKLPEEKRDLEAVKKVVVDVLSNYVR